MGRRYYTLVQFENGKWSPQFGDYVKKAVKDEYDDYRSQGVVAGDMMIICTKEDQASIDAEIQWMNDQENQ